MARTSLESDQTRRRKLWVQLTILVVVIGFVLLRPRIEAWLDARAKAPAGADGPAVPVNSDAHDGVASGAPDAESAGERSTSKTQVNWKQINPDAGSDSAEADARRKAAESDDLLVFDESSTRDDTSSSADTKSNETAAPPATTPKANPPSGTAQSSAQETTQNSTNKSDAAKNPKPRDEPQPGQLTEIRRGVFESTAGLIYRSGSADGHRIAHVLQHGKDDPGKPKHGVFDGDREVILAVIDEAFLKSQAGGKDVRSDDQNGRTVMTINLKRRIGYEGGSEGARSGNRECRYLRVVLENDVEVVTAYPTRTF